MVHPWSILSDTLHQRFSIQLLSTRKKTTSLYNWTRNRITVFWGLKAIWSSFWAYCPTSRSIILGAMWATARTSLYERNERMEKWRRTCVVRRTLSTMGSQQAIKIPHNNQHCKANVVICRNRSVTKTLSGPVCPFAAKLQRRCETAGHRAHRPSPTCRGEIDCRRQSKVLLASLWSREPWSATWIRG